MEVANQEKAEQLRVDNASWQNKFAQVEADHQCVVEKFTNERTLLLDRVAVSEQQQKDEHKQSCARITELEMRLEDHVRQLENSEGQLADCVRNLEHVTKVREEISCDLKKQEFARQEFD